MTIKTFILFLLLTVVASCNHSRKQDGAQQETPKALEDKGASYSIASKRGYDDLVESLYNELLEKDQGLKALENKIQALNESKNDSTKSFDAFNSKSQRYYTSANAHIDGLNDSLLKIKMRLLITNSLNKYNGTTGRHTALLKSIETQSLILTDLHTVLKITRTLPLIENYQRSNIPSTGPVEGFIQKQAEAVKLADTLSKK